MGYYKSLKNRVDSAKESPDDTDDLLPMDHNDRD
jgi:hypothetical protein